MKKLIASVIFFGSFGMAFAQMGPGGINQDLLKMRQYYAQMMDQYQYPQCVTQTTLMPRKIRDNCESVWNHSAAGSSQPKEGEEYVPPFSATHDSDFTAIAYTRFLNAHKNDDLVRPNCNKYKSSPGMCNAQMIYVKKSGGFLGFLSGASSAQGVQGCRYYPTMVNERKTVTTCPRPKPVESGICNASCNLNYGKICCSTTGGVMRWDGSASKSEECISIEEAKKRTDGRGQGLKDTPDGLTCSFFES